MNKNNQIQKAYVVTLELCEGVKKDSEETYSFVKISTDIPYDDEVITINLTCNDFVSRKLLQSYLKKYLKEE